MATLNGARVINRGKVKFVLLPRDAWREINGGCSCCYCSDDGRPARAFWDTLAVHDEGAHAWEVHAPEMHGASTRRTSAGWQQRSRGEVQP